MRMGWRGALAAAAGMVVLASMTAAPASARSPEKTIEHLRHELRTATHDAKRYRHQRDTARRHAKTYRRQRDTARRTVGRQDRTITALRGELRTTSDKLATADGQIGPLQSENASLRAGLPSSVVAIAKTGNITDLFNLVILPAHRAWACGGFTFFGASFYEVDFDRLDSQGFCY